MMASSLRTGPATDRDWSANTICSGTIDVSGNSSVPQSSSRSAVRASTPVSTAMPAPLAMGAAAAIRMSTSASAPLMPTR